MVQSLHVRSGAFVWPQRLCYATRRLRLSVHRMCLCVENCVGIVIKVYTENNGGSCGCCVFVVSTCRFGSFSWKEAEEAEAASCSFLSSRDELDVCFSCSVKPAPEGEDNQAKFQHHQAQRFLSAE
ncbi:uncharacterized protein V6R79_022030 [Siganus canaliculatus]